LTSIPSSTASSSSTSSSVHWFNTLQGVGIYDVETLHHLVLPRLRAHLCLYALRRYSQISRHRRYHHLSCGWSLLHGCTDSIPPFFLLSVLSGCLLLCCSLLLLSLSLSISQGSGRTVKTPLRFIDHAASVQCVETIGVHQIHQVLRGRANARTQKLPNIASLHGYD
jgi:hypothetical protein